MAVLSEVYNSALFTKWLYVSTAVKITIDSDRLTLQHLLSSACTCQLLLIYSHALWSQPCWCAGGTAEQYDGPGDCWLWTHCEVTAWSRCWARRQSSDVMWRNQLQRPAAFLSTETAWYVVIHITHWTMASVYYLVLHSLAAVCCTVTRDILRWPCMSRRSLMA